MAAPLACDGTPHAGTETRTRYESASRANKRSRRRTGRSRTSCREECSTISATVAVERLRRTKTSDEIAAILPPALGRISHIFPAKMLDVRLMDTLKPHRFDALDEAWADGAVSTRELARNWSIALCTNAVGAFGIAVPHCSPFVAPVAAYRQGVRLW